MPPLTIIITFYDETAYLDMAVSSVSGQGIDEIELIIVNDNPARFGPDYFEGLGLPDGTRVLHHDVNKGLAAARNTGIDAARGKLIGFLDADDYYVAGGLARQFAEAVRSKADIVHAPCYLSRPRSPEIDVLHRDRQFFLSPKTGWGLRAIEEAQFITSSWSSLYRADFLAEFGLRFDEEQPKFEDRIFVLDTVTRARLLTFSGEPARVWRRRAGSISMSRTDPDIERLKLQMIEKCMLRMRGEVAEGRLPARFYKRELFNTLSRLIWDMEIIDLIATRPTADTAEFGRRIQRLLGADSFGHAIFNDPMIGKISRVGMKTRRGHISRGDFFAIHKALREGDFGAAKLILDTRKAERRHVVPARTMRVGKTKLFLHLGTHKTGSTFLQGQLMHHRQALMDQGILFPKAGLAEPDFARTRDGAFPGHAALLAALRADDPEPWTDMRIEVAKSRAKAVVLSCENMLLPLNDDREALLDRLRTQLSWFGSVQPIAFVRRPDTYLEAYYREIVSNGLKMGSRTIAEFFVDAADALTDLPGLFAPFEEITGNKVQLADYDAAGTADDLWPTFQRLIGIAQPLPTADVPRYRSLGRATIEAARIVNTLIDAAPQRIDTLRDFFKTAPRDADTSSLLDPGQRRLLVDKFEAASIEYAAERGYQPDLQALRQDIGAGDWSPLAGLPRDMVEAMLRSRVRCEKPHLAEAGATGSRPRRERRRGLTVTIRPRPWVLETIARVGGLRRLFSASGSKPARYRPTDALGGTRPRTP